MLKGLCKTNSHCTEASDWWWLRSHGTGEDIQNKLERMRITEDIPVNNRGFLLNHFCVKYFDKYKNKSNKTLYGIHQQNFTNERKTLTIIFMDKGNRRE